MVIFHIHYYGTPVGVQWTTFCHWRMSLNLLFWAKKLVQSSENCFYDDLGENRLNDMDKTVTTPQARYCIQ